MDRSEAQAPVRVGAAFASLGTREAICAQHGPFQAEGRMLGKREVWTGCKACEAQVRQAEQEERERAAAVRRESERVAAIGLAAIPARFTDRSFENFVADTPEKQRALAKVRDFVEQFEANAGRGGGLILAGLPGTGKTHLGSAALLSLIGPRCWTQYVTCMGLIRMVRETWRKDSERTERQVLQMLGSQIDLLVIDEVGVQYGTEGEQTVLFEVLDRRYADMRPSLLITNQDKAGFREFVGDRVADRLTQTHDWVAFDWPSYRRQARKEEA